MKQAIGYTLLIVGTFALVTPSALTGATNPSIADALGTTKPEMPRMATGRDYLDNPTSLNGLNKLY